MSKSSFRNVRAIVFPALAICFCWTDRAAAQFGPQLPTAGMNSMRNPAAGLARPGIRGGGRGTFRPTTTNSLNRNTNRSPNGLMTDRVRRESTVDKPLYSVPEAPVRRGASASGGSAVAERLLDQIRRKRGGSSMDDDADAADLAEAGDMMNGFRIPAGFREVKRTRRGGDLAVSPNDARPSPEEGEPEPAATVPTP